MFVKVLVDASPPQVTLEEPADCTRFHVAAVAGADDTARLDRALRDASVGRVDGGDDARVDVDAVRRMADGRVGPGWDGDFDRMRAYARDKGWLDDAGATIAAHVEWVSNG